MDTRDTPEALRRCNTKLSEDPIPQIKPQSLICISGYKTESMDLSQGHW